MRPTSQLQQLPHLGGKSHVEAGSAWERVTRHSSRTRLTVVSKQWMVWTPREPPRIRYPHRQPKEGRMEAVCDILVTVRQKQLSHPLHPAQRRPISLPPKHRRPPP